MVKTTWGEFYRVGERGGRWIHVHSFRTNICFIRCIRTTTNAVLFGEPVEAGPLSGRSENPIASSQTII